MKHCPECNFSFPDFHRVCDFDGTELVQSPERQSLMTVPKHVPHPRLGLKKPMLLTSLAVLGVFLSAVFIGYLESPAPTIPALVKDQEVQNSARGLSPSDKTTEQVAKVKKTAGPSKRSVSRSGESSPPRRLRGFIESPQRIVVRETKSRAHKIPSALQVKSHRRLWRFSRRRGKF